MNPTTRYRFLIVLSILAILLASLPGSPVVTAQAPDSIKVPPDLTPDWNFSQCDDETFWYQWGDGTATGYITLNTDNPDDSTNSAVWRPTIPISGTYLVEAYFPVLTFSNVPANCFNAPNPDRFTTEAGFTITSAGGVTETVVVDENSTGRWISLGTYTFDGGTSGFVHLSDLTSEAALSRFVAFSDIRFTYMDNLVNKTYMPAIFTKDEPVVIVQSAWTEDVHNDIRIPFLHGEMIYFNVSGTNRLATQVLANFNMKVLGPCGETPVFSGQIPVSPGTWNLEKQAQAPNCPGIHFLVVEAEYREQVSTFNTLFVVKQESIVIPTTQQFFDKCEVASIANMSKWWAGSPYFHTNLYIGGVSRACDNDLLNAVWVQQAEDQGWGFVPAWVGPQAPCTTFRNKFSYDEATAYNQGVNEANAAVDAAQALGFFGNNVIYYDLEGFSGASQSCRNAAKSFLNGWTFQLHQLGYVSGIYGGSCSSYANDWLTIANPPDEVWLAHWIYSFYRPTASPYGMACVTDDKWEHHRLRQYAGGHNESWGNDDVGYVTFNIDSNASDGNVVTTQGIQAAETPVIEANEVVVDAQLVSSTQGWAIQGSRLMWTEDTGASWNDITPAQTTTGYPLSAYFLDSSRGWVLVDSDGLTMMKTVDGGSTWTESRLPVLESGGTVRSMGFSDELNGWVQIQLTSSSNFSLGVLLRTLDGGANWVRIDLPTSGEMTFSDPFTGWLVGGPEGTELYRSQDAGATWQSIPLPAAGQVSLPVFSTALDGMVAVTTQSDERGWVELFATEDGGDRWTSGGILPLDSPQDTRALLALSSPGNWITALPEDGELYTARGQAVTALSAGSLPNGIVDLDFVRQTGWALTFTGTCSGEKGTASFSCTAQSSLYLTQDGGRTWSEITP